MKRRSLRRLLGLGLVTLVSLSLVLGLKPMLATSVPVPSLTQGQVPQSLVSPNLVSQSLGTAPQGLWRSASFPVENFQAYTSSFGYRRSATGGSTQEFHYGLDIAAPLGSYIRSWWMGQVVEVSDDSRCGTSVVVESGTWEHIYCHLQGKVEVIRGQRYMVDREGGLQIREGQVLSTGTRIGRVGMTGRTTGPHLHWGMKNKGQWVDPARVLRAMQSSQIS